jgi:hypothetical protein
MSELFSIGEVDECKRSKMPRMPEFQSPIEVYVMNSQIHLQNVVALNLDIPEHGLKRGQVGTVVEVLDNDIFEVEFASNDGGPYEMAALTSAELIPLGSGISQYRLTA